jgi:hypothetical protein
MLIELNVDYTLAAAPPPSFQLFFYWREVGASTYTLQTLNNPGSSGTATITIINNSNGVITDPNTACSLEYEGYMIPSCFVGTPSEESEKVDFTFSVPITSLTDYMECRGIDATCTTGAIVGFKVLNDPDTYDVSQIHIDPTLFIPPTWILVSGSGDPNNLPTFGNNNAVGGDGILMGFNFNGTISSGANVSLKNNSFFLPVFQDIVPVRTNSEAISTNNGFDSSTVVKLELLNNDGDTIQLDVELIIACGAVSPVFYCGDPLLPRKSSYTPLGQTTRYCLFNKNGNSEPGFEEAAFQELYTTDQYTCCQTTECRNYTITYLANPLPQLTGGNPVLFGLIANAIQLEYIDAARERQTVTLSTGISQTINAIENTVRPFTTNVGNSPANGDYTINNTMIAFSDSSFFSIVDNGPCS